MINRGCYSLTDLSPDRRTLGQTERQNVIPARSLLFYWYPETTLTTDTVEYPPTKTIKGILEYLLRGDEKGQMQLDLHRNHTCYTFDSRQNRETM